MSIGNKIKHLVNHSSSSRGIDDELFLSREVFRKIIDRERNRANRTGEVFSLVVFALPARKEECESLTHLAEALSSRVRAIDAVGWLDMNHIGVLLPETESSGAKVFARKINHELNNIEILLAFEVYTYPSDQIIDPENQNQETANKAAVHKRKFFSPRRGWRINEPQSHVDYMFCLTRRALKRGFDILVAITCLLLFSPLFLAITFLIKLVSPGPVFYKQQRIGYAGRPFTFLKFRTMSTGADTHGHQEYLAQLIRSESNASKADMPMTKMDHDPQIIKCGNLLRKSCLDELPQLLNVLRGEMSLVGPRPPIPYEVKEYLPWHRGRFDAIPGMTGLWQVSGKNKLSFRDMVRLDIRYARERSLWLDIKILMRTPLAIFVQVRDGLKSKNSIIEEGT